jgi:TolB-like protein
MKNRLFFKRGIRVVCILAITSVLSVSDTSAYEKEINRLSLELADKIAGSGVKKVAVVDFTNIEGNVTALGRFIAEEFSVALAESGKEFQVVDRTHLKSIIKEHKLLKTGLIDPDTARQLGKIAGVEALITGSLTPFGDSVRLVVKVLNTETAAIIGSKRGNIPKTNAIAALIERDIQSGGPTTPTPTKIPKKGKWVQKAKGFTFELVSCKRQGGSVKCELFITSDTDKNLSLYGNDHRGFQRSGFSRLFDDFSNSYKASNVSLATIRSEHFGHTDIIGGIRTKASLSFEEVATDATHAAVVELTCWSDKKFNVRFRNIPFK